MKLMHPMLSKPLSWEEGGIPVLVLESPQLFRQWVFALTAQSQGEEGAWVLSDQDDLLDFADHLQVVREYTQFPLESRKLQHRFQVLVQSMMWEELEAETQALQEQIQGYLAHLAAWMPLPVGYTEGDVVWPLLKTLKFQPVLDGETPLERLIQYLELFHHLMLQPCVVLVGLHLYFTLEELEKLYRMAQYQKWNLLVVEPHLEKRLPQESVCIFDCDLCELRVDFEEKGG